MSSGSEVIERDSEMPLKALNSESKSMNRLYEILKQNAIFFKIDEKGTVFNITGFDEINRKLDKLGYANDVKRIGLNETSFKQSLKYCFGEYPPNNAKIGDFWKKVDTLSSAGVEMLIEYEYHLVSIKNNVIVKFISSVKSINQNDNKFINGNGSGIYSYDLSTGLPDNVDLHLKTQMRTVANNKEVLITLTNTSNYKAKRKIFNR